jgi:hypothetical protein
VLSFSYTLQPGDNSADLDYLSTTALALNGGTIKGATGTDAVLSLPAPGASGSLGANKDIVVLDATAPSVVIAGPSGIVTSSFTATFTFSEPVTGFAAADITVVGGTRLDASFTGSGASYSIDIDPVQGEMVSVSVAAAMATDGAGNGNTVSNTLEIQAGSAASEFAAREGEIRAVIVADAQRVLRNGIAFNQRLVRGAHDRMCRRDPEDQSLMCPEDVPFDVDGSAEYTDGSFATQGTFYQQNRSETGQRLVFGDFNIQTDADGSSTVAVTANSGWERMVSDHTLFGYYLGFQSDRSMITGTFSGTRDGYALNTGAYVVTELWPDLFADGFVAASIGQNELAMSNGTLDLESTHMTQSLNLGASLSGEVAFGELTIKPELAVAAGRMFIGDVGFRFVSLNGGSQITAHYAIEDVNNASRSSAQFGLELRF